MDTNEWFWLKFLLEMKVKAKECRSRKRKVMYTEREKKVAMRFRLWVADNGGSDEDAAELLSMNKRTLQGWVALAL